MEVFKAYPLETLFIILSTIILVLIFQGIFKKLWRNFYSNAPLIKKYWLFVLPFVALSYLGYFLVLKNSPLDKIAINVSIFNQCLTLVFAIFVGFFAFLQVVETRFDKLTLEGYTYFRRRLYIRAIRCCEEAHAINPKDFITLCNLLELYLITKNEAKFDLKIDLLKKLIMEEVDDLSFRYLRIAKFLLKQELGEAKKELESTIEFIQKCPDSLVTFSWQFDDIKNSEIYKKLNGEAKTIFENLIKYLSKTLLPPQKKDFEEGNYSVP